MVLIFRYALSTQQILQEQEFISGHVGEFLICWGSDESLEELGSEGRYFGLRDDAFSVKADEVKNAVEGVLLPFEVVGVASCELVVGREAAILRGEGEDGHAEGGDSVLERRVIHGRVSVRHCCCFFLLFPSSYSLPLPLALQISSSSSS